MGNEQPAGALLSRLNRAADDLHDSLERIDRERESGEDLGRLIAGTMDVSRDLFRQMEDFIGLVVQDLEDTRERLDRDSGRMLGEVSEQLNRVTESTQDAVQKVLNRVDTICERQNDVFQRLDELRRGIEEVKDEECGSRLNDLADKLVSLENDIQTETFEIMNEMQFQDITSQQLQSANQMISAARDKLTDFRQVLDLFEPPQDQRERGGVGSGDKRTYDPGATTERREERQRIADEIESGYVKRDRDSG